MVYAGRLLAMLTVSVVACAAGPTVVRQGVDPDAMREAMEASAPSRYTSSRAYLHYMRGMLARYEGDTGRAVAELREALVFDADSPYLRTVLADELASAGELDRALAEVQSALARSPSFAPAHFLAGKIYAAKRQVARAEAAYEKAISSAAHCSGASCHPARDEDRDVYRALWTLHIEQGVLDKAEEVVDRYSRLHEEDPSGYVSLAHALSGRAQKDPAKVEQLLEKALQRAPSSEEVLKELAELKAERRQYADAIGYYERALRREPDDREVLAALGMLHLRRREDADARAYYDRLMNLDPASVELPLWAARSYLGARRHALALEALELAEKRDPKNRRVSFLRGWVMQDGGDFAGAAKQFAAVGREDEDYDAAQMHLGYCLSRAGKHEEALALLARRAAEQPDRAEVLVALAEAYQRAGRPAQGIELLEHALPARTRSAPTEEHEADLAEALARLYQAAGRAKDAVALIQRALDAAVDDALRDRLLYALGNAHERAGDPMLAVSTVKKILERNPDDARALNFIGYTWAERKVHLDEAAKMLERAYELRPEDGYIADSLGWLYYQRGEYAKAADLLTRADELSPFEPVILTHLGDALLKLDRHADARAAFERAQQALLKNPDPEAERALAGRLRELARILGRAE